MPTDWSALGYARSQVGISLAFHIVFAAAGVARAGRAAARRELAV